MQPKLPQTVQNSKLLVECAKTVISKRDGGVYSVGCRVGFVTNALKPEQAATLLGKIKKALGSFKDDLVLQEFVVQVNEDTSEFNTEFANATKEIFYKKLEKRKGTPVEEAIKKAS